MPAASIFTTLGTSTSSAPTLKLNLPGTSMRTLPLRRPKTSTPISSVPRTPSRSAVTPLPDCDIDGVVIMPGIGAEPPKARLARSTPMAMVRTSRPSLNPTSAMPTFGPWSMSGPIDRPLRAGAAPAADGSSVNRSIRAMLDVPSIVVQELTRKFTWTSPAVNIETVFVGSLSFR